MPQAKPEGAVPVSDLLAGHGPAPSQPKDDQVLDLDAFSPLPRWVRKGGMAYAMRSFFDIKGSELLELFRLEDQAKADPGRGLPDIQRKQVRLLCPDMPEHVLADLSQQELLAIVNDGWVYRRPLGMAPGAAPAPGPVDMLVDDGREPPGCG